MPAISETPQPWCELEVIQVVWSEIAEWLPMYKVRLLAMLGTFATPDCETLWYLPVETGLLDALQRLKRGSKTHESAEVDSNDIRSWYDWFQDHVVVVNDLNAIVRLVVKTVSKREISRIKRERGDFATEAEVATKLRLKLNREPAEEDKDLLIGEENSFQLANDSDHVLVEICGGWKLLRRGHVLVVKS